MSTTLKGRVTSEILRRTKNCKACDTKYCALAEALKPVFPFVSVGPTDFVVDYRVKPEDAVRIILPVSAREFVYIFDTSTPEQREQMPELEFEVVIPDEVLEQINIGELKPLLVNHPNLELIEA